MHWRQRPSLVGHRLVGRRSSFIVGITHFKIQMSLSQKESTPTDRAKGSPRRTHQSKRLQGFAPLLLTLLGACVGWLSRKTLRSIFLPFGLAKRLPEVPTYAPVDFSNDSLMAKHGKLSKIFERVEHGQKALMNGPETIFFDDDGMMYATTEDANLIRFSDIQMDIGGRITAKTTLVKNLGVGRPLAAKFLGSTLYIADAVLGLTRVQNVFDPKSKVELVVNKVKENGSETRIHFADDIAVAPKSGMVYLTDATEIPPQSDGDMKYDCLYPSKVEALRGPSGRLLRYDPSTDEILVLARDLYFGNGVAIAEDESYLVYVESFNSRVVKYYLSGERQGIQEHLINGYPSPAWFDGVDCAWKRFGANSTLCYAVGFSSVVHVAKLIFKLPEPLQLFLRNLLMMVPPSLAPKPQPYAGIAIFDPESSRHIELIQDPKGQDVKALTGVTFYGNKLYLGSLHNDYIAVYDLL